jgi:hypothetical protein
MGRFSRFAASCAALVLTLAACSGGGGGGGGSSSSGGTSTAPAAVAQVPDLSGRWNASETGTSTCANQTSYVDNYEVTLAQSGQNLTVTTPFGTFSGVVDASDASWAGSFAENGGTTTITALTLSWNNDFTRLSGSASWDWVNGSQTCSGSIQPLVLTKYAPAVPSAPSLLSATATSDTGIRLAWTDNAANETGFTIERSASSNGPFDEIASLPPDTASYDGAGLAASTTYYFRVRATGAAGESAYSNVASATTLASGLVAPTNLAATAVSSTTIDLAWTDNAAAEAGYRIERGTSVNDFVPIAEVGANTQAYASTGLTPGTTYLYRVRAFTANGNSDYSNVAQATTQSIPNYTLDVKRSGAGSGTVGSSPSGISCGTTCTAQFPATTGVTLSAAPATGSVFDSWDGCDSIDRAANPPTCSLTLKANRTVTATFNPDLSGTPTISLPERDADGSYTLSWTWSGANVPVGWVIHEAPDTTFAKPAVYDSNDTASPYTLEFTAKADGNYCYRVRSVATSNWSAPECIAVARPQFAVLEVVNRTRYDLVDIRLMSKPQLAFPDKVLIGKSRSFLFGGSGAVDYVLGAGFYTDQQTPNVWFPLSGTTKVTVGQTTVVTFNNPTIAQLLAGFAAARNWDAYYRDARQNDRFPQFTFASDGTWTLTERIGKGGPELLDKGMVTLLSWPNYASTVTFKLCDGCAEIKLAHPFESFRYGHPRLPALDYKAAPIAR